MWMLIFSLAIGHWSILPDEHKEQLILREIAWYKSQHHCERVKYNMREEGKYANLYAICVRDI